MRAKVHAHIDCITRIFSFYFSLGKGNTGSILLYFIINLKGKQVAFKIPFLLTKNERVMNNKEGGTA